MPDPSILKPLVEPVNNLLNPPAKAIGNTLASIWNATFGWIDHFNDKSRLKKQHELKEFAKNLEDEIGKIPDDDKIEPKLSIAGPALEASKFYIEEESLRKMFAKLLANSMNKNMAKDVQASFVEIIKQMTPLDAELLSIFVELKVDSLPYGSFRKNNKNGSHLTIIPLAYWTATQTEASCNDNAVSICNLERLGLLRLNDREWLNESSYIHYKKSSFVLKQGLDFRKGVIDITDYGKAFTRTCFL